MTTEEAERLLLEKPNEHATLTPEELAAILLEFSVALDRPGPPTEDKGD